ncbi:F-box domain-containing protein [Artemisia annua]|uniref:F-box domain-containing protein n=1 Tax=Artemisia annua TaxID=35608 RepID=A0A2U1PB00_ARTAN|nr:F-box domain-containing protein [Artemisia annua]
MVSPPRRIPDHKHFRLIGSVNGTVLFVTVSHANMILYNPFTGAAKKVPNLPPHHGSPCRYVYGFGYGATPDDLKIVKIHVASNGCSSRYYCDVFRLKTRSWNTHSHLISDDMCFQHDEYNGVFVNGFMYWSGYNYIRRMILALDVKNMIFSEIKPCAPVSLLHPLGTFKGSLCAICFQTSPKYELWVMNEKSWSKVCSLTSLWKDNYIRTSLNMGMCILDEGKIVMLKDLNEVIIYDMLKDSYKKVKTVMKRRPGLQAVEYMESCVSLSL